MGEAIETKPLSDSEEVALTNFMIALKGPVEFSCQYRNWRGETSVRRIRLIEMWFGSTEWHPEPGLLLKATDLDKNEVRDFRLVDFDMATARPLPNSGDAE